MDIETIVGRKQVTLRIRGRVTMPDGAQLKSLVVSLLEKGHRHFVVNLHEATEIDSFGLGDFVAASAAVSRAGGSIRFQSTGRLRELLSTTKLLDAIDRRPARGWAHPYLWIVLATAFAGILLTWVLASY